MGLRGAPVTTGTVSLRVSGVPVGQPPSSRSGRRSSRTRAPEAHPATGHPCGRLAIRGQYGPLEQLHSAQVDGQAVPLVIPAARVHCLRPNQCAHRETSEQSGLSTEGLTCRPVGCGSIEGRPAVRSAPNGGDRRAAFGVADRTRAPRSWSSRRRARVVRSCPGRRLGRPSTRARGTRSRADIRRTSRSPSRSQLLPCARVASCIASCRRAIRRTSDPTSPSVQRLLRCHVQFSERCLSRA